jgi:acyl-CoA synthetase (AMP-forming)/AMP-acid ligase II
MAATPATKIREQKRSKAKPRLTEAQIAVHWKEEEHFRPSKEFIAQANLAAPAFIKKFSEKNFPQCFEGPRPRRLHFTKARRSRHQSRARQSHVHPMIGKIARPKQIHIVPDMPKTRSGKIMRRVLAAISNRMDTGDITTLANPDIVEQIRELVQGRAVLPVQEGPEDIKRFGQES